MLKAKKRGLTLGLLLTMLLAFAGCGGASQDSSFPGDDKEEATTASTEAATTQEETSAEEIATQASEEETSTQGETAAVDCSFTLEGKSYTLPFDYSTLEADGWKTTTDMNQDINAMTYGFIYIYKGDKVHDNLTVDIYNGSGDKQKLKDCQIASIEVSKRGLDNYSFTLANGIKPGDDKATVEKIMGPPTTEDESDNYYRSYYGEDRDTGQIQFVWWKDPETKENGNDSISLSYFKRIATATSTQGADYLDSYKAPTMLGEDFNSSTVSIDKVIYRLPCPVAEFTKNGWSLKKEESVMAGRDAYCYLEKDGKELSITVTNYADVQLGASLCAVSSIDANHYSDSDPYPDVLLPKNISFSSTLEELKAALISSSFEFQENKADDNSYVSYSCDDYKTGIHVYFYFDNKDQKIKSIKYKSNKWPGK